MPISSIQLADMLSRGLTVADQSPTSAQQCGYVAPQRPIAGQVDSPQGNEPHDGPERDLQSDCERWLKFAGCRCIHLREAKGNQPGIPDLIIQVRGGLTLYVELKSAKGKLRKCQEEWIEESRAIGHDVHICRSLDDLIALVRESQSSHHDNAQ